MQVWLGLCGWASLLRPISPPQMQLEKLIRTAARPIQRMALLTLGVMVQRLTFSPGMKLPSIHLMNMATWRV